MRALGGSTIGAWKPGNLKCQHTHTALEFCRSYYKAPAVIPQFLLNHPFHASFSTPYTLHHYPFNSAASYAHIHTHYAKMSSTDDSQNAKFESLRHWSMFGRMGEACKDRVQRGDKNLKDIQIPITAQWEVSVPRSELTKLLNGFQPREMEDKWFVYADGPDAEGTVVVHMHRSWTGYENFRLLLHVPLDAEGNLEEEDSNILELTWETDETRYRGGGEAEAKEIAEGVCSWVLGVKLNKPAAPDETSPAPNQDGTE
jgi:hypothetical protein